MDRFVLSSKEVREGRNMLKRFIACIMIALSLLTFTNFSYASNVVDASKYEILNPEKISYSTRDRVVLINGKAPAGTEITINLYGTTDLTRSRFNLDKMPTQDDYILLSTEGITSGNLNLFQKQLDLVKGINKIMINFGVEGVENKEIIVYVYNRNRLVIRENSNSNNNVVLPLLK